MKFKIKIKRGAILLLALILAGTASLAVYASVSYDSSKDPVVAFRQMSYDMFDEMTSAIREDTVKIILSAHFKSEEEIKREQVAKVTSATAGGGDGSEKGRTVRNDKKKVGVNDPCPCGSGKKYTKCCGRPGADKA